MNGYILIHRKLLNWQWYKDSNTLHLFIDLLLDANYEDSKVGFQIVKRGQCLTSLKRMHENTGLTYQQIRTSLSKLEKSGEINKQTTNKYSIITINKYNDYQELNKQITNKQQTNNNIIIKNNKNNKYKESISKDIPKKVFIKPSIEEIQEYCNERNNNVDANRFYNFYESKGWMVGSNKMKDWKAAVRTWEQKEEKLPGWWNKDFKERERTEDEERQLQELIRGNKR